MSGDKKALRKIWRAAIELLEPEYMESADKKIFSRVIVMPRYKEAKNIFCYCSVRHEVDTREIIKHAMLSGKNVYLPVICGNGIMEAVLMEDIACLSPGKMNIPEPPRNGARLVPGYDDMAIVPAVAYDRRGYRLGQGGGYYDRFLKDWPGVSVGLCRSKLVVDEIPLEEHDMGVDVLITEEQIM